MEDENEKPVKVKFRHDIFLVVPYGYHNMLG